MSRTILALHRDERGADEGINKLMIFALVALPLIALLIAFGGKIKTYAESLFNSTMGKGVK